MTVNIKKEINDDMIVEILSSGLVYEWFILDNTTEEWQKARNEIIQRSVTKDKPKPRVCIEDIALYMLKNGIPVIIGEDEDEDSSYSKEHILTMEKLQAGIEKSINAGYWDGDFDNLDSDSADIIMQCALLGDVVYG